MRNHACLSNHPSFPSSLILQVLDVLFATCKAMPGVERLIRHLKASGIPMVGETVPVDLSSLSDQATRASGGYDVSGPNARLMTSHSCTSQAVATSSHRRHFELKTSGHKELFSLFDHVLTGDQVGTRV